MTMRRRRPGKRLRSQSCSTEPPRPGQPWRESVATKYPPSAKKIGLIHDGPAAEFLTVGLVYLSHIYEERNEILPNRSFRAAAGNKLVRETIASKICRETINYRRRRGASYFKIARKIRQ